MNAGGSRYWMALGLSLLFALGATYWFLNGGQQPTLESEWTKEADGAEPGTVVPAAQEESDNGLADSEPGTDADVTFSFAQEVARFEGGVLEQDDLHRLFYKDTEGNTRWELSMEGPVMGVHHFDANGDGDKEFLLIDQEHMLGLDPGGRPIPGFSIRPTSAITAQAVVDYDGDGNERYLLGLADGRMLNHRNLGESTPGWRHTSKGSPIQSIAHLRAGRKDFICTVDESGVVMLLKRNGQRRVRTAVQLQPQKGERAVAFEVKSDIGSSLLISRNSEGVAETRRFDNGVPLPASEAERQLLEAAESRSGSGVY
jgi:hypothetical protein